jgi:hypothetical protein
MVYCSVFMSDAPAQRPGFFKPAFIIGVTGHIDLDPAYRDRVKTAVKRIVTWLRQPSSPRDAKRVDRVLGPGLGLVNTPVLLLSSLAPGADQWVAEAATEMDPLLKVLAPLPFFKDQYLRASTFRQNGLARDEAAGKYLAEFPDRDTFIVRLAGDADLDNDALRAKFESILGAAGHEEERHRRYTGAGAFVALFSNILIAVTDKPAGLVENELVITGAEAGARNIAVLKRRGMLPGMIPILPVPSWADSGPVIHIYAPRKSALSPGDNSATDTGALEIFYPGDWSSPEAAQKPAHGSDLRAAQELRAMALHLERLNTETIRVDPCREDRALIDMLPVFAEGGQGDQHDKPELAATGEMRANPDRIARLRRRMADYSAYYNVHLNRLKRLLFTLAFCAAFFFSLADSWEATAATSWLPEVYFMIAFGLTAAAWVVYFFFKKTAAAERCDNYRAITEGLRVQFYWMACGGGESVASNYLQHLGGELGWIRHVIGVAGLPHEQDRVWFNQLSPGDQLTLLRSIRTAWIGGQCAYFTTRVEELERRREIFTSYAHVLLWTGFVLFAFLVFYTQGAASLFLSRTISILFCCTGFAILALLFQVSRSGRSAASSKSFSGVNGEEQKQELTAQRRLHSWVDRLVSLPSMLIPDRARWSETGRLLINVLLVAAFTLILIGTIYLLEGVVPVLPSANKLGSIFKYLTLAGGVLCGAWVEVNFFAEHARHYGSMASLFQAAGQRFDDCIAWSEKTEGVSNEAARKRIIDSLRSLIIAVGREALSENADWLIMHRSRPLEPVSV